MILESRTAQHVFNEMTDRHLIMLHVGYRKIVKMVPYRKLVFGVQKSQLPVHTISLNYTDVFIWFDCEKSHCVFVNHARIRSWKQSCSTEL